MALGFLAGSGSQIRPASAATQATSAKLQQDFALAAKEFGVPESVLLAVGYQESLWESHGGHPSMTGNYNVMGLTHLNPSDAAPLSAAQRRAALGGPGKGHASAFRPSSAALAAVNRIPAHDPSLHTMDAAAGLIHQPLAALRTSMQQSVRGGAALLAHDERAALGHLPASPGQWYAAVARYSGATDVQGARLFANRVFSVIRHGAARTTTDGQRVTLAADPSVTPDTSSLTQSTLTPHTGTTAVTRQTGASAADGSASSHPAHVTLTAAQGLPAQTAECPSSLSCTFQWAAYTGTSSDYGNFDFANRPADGDAIRYIVIHDAEGSYSGTISTFANSKTLAYASANYVISSTGEVTQMVPTKDIAWHAGNWYVNMHSVGIEHEGYAMVGDATWYTPSEYQSSAALVKYLAGLYNIPLDRQHIIGHSDVPGPTDYWASRMHWDPGPYWNWNYLMSLVGAPIRTSDAGSLPVGSEITIDPPFTSANEPTLTGCSGLVSGTSCTPEPANFVYLRTTHSSTAPYLSDPYIGSDLATDGWDWGDKAVSGQTFVVAGEYGKWTAIWYAGTKAWFYNPNGQNAKPATQTQQMVVTPTGTSAIPVYGRAYPGSSAYPQGVTAEPISALSKYSIQPGQEYVPGAEVNGTYADTNYSSTYTVNETVVTDTGTQYYPIRFNHRLAYVMASDVKLVPATLPPSLTPVPPVRVLDTRHGIGGFSSPVGSGQTISLQVTGQNGVPSGATAVVLNVTAVNPTEHSFVTVYPDGKGRPNASNLNFNAGQIIPNLVIVPVGSDGKVDFYNNVGKVNLIADLSGYYSTSTGSWFDSTGPVRVLDTRHGIGGFSSPVGPGQTISLQVTGQNGVPSGATAVVLNVTAVNPTEHSFVTVYPDGTGRPNASNLNFNAGQVFPNLVVVPVGSDGKVDFYNNAGNVDLIADLSGYYSTSTGSWFDSTGPVRVLDTRHGTGGYSSPVGPGKTISLKVTGKDGVPPSGVTAVVLNVTAVNPTAHSFVTVYPDGKGRPNASNLNFNAGQVFPNLVVVPVGSDGKVDFYNNAGSVDLIADLSGYFMK